MEKSTKSKQKHKSPKAIRTKQTGICKKSAIDLTLSQPTLTQCYVHRLTEEDIKQQRRKLSRKQTNKKSHTLVSPEKRYEQVLQETLPPEMMPGNCVIAGTQDLEDFIHAQPELSIPSSIENEEERMLDDIERHEQDEEIDEELMATYNNRESNLNTRNSTIENDNSGSGCTNTRNTHHNEPEEDLDDEVVKTPNNPQQDVNTIQLTSRSDNSGLDCTNSSNYPGTIKSYTTPLGSLEYVTAQREYFDNNRSIAEYMKVTRPSFDQVFSTFFHFKDNKYNACLHKIVNGVIKEWRKGIVEICNKLDKMSAITNREGYQNQRKYAETTALYIQHSIATYDEFPVKILNMTWLKKMVPAIKTEEDATFVYHMSNSKYFVLMAMRDNSSREINIITRFDDKHNALFGNK